MFSCHSKKENESIVVNEVNYTVSDVEGTVENGKADIHLKITPAAMGMAISLDFTTEYAADAVVGKWAGNLNMTVEMGGGKTMEMEPLAMTLTVEKIDDNTVTVTTEEFAAMENMTIPAFTIEDVAAAKAGGNTVTLSKDDFSMVIGGSNYKFTSFTGEYSKGVFTLHFGLNLLLSKSYKMTREKQRRVQKKKKSYKLAWQRMSRKACN